MIKRIYTVNWKVVGGFRVEANNALDAESEFYALFDSENTENVKRLFQSVIDTEVIDVEEVGEVV